MEKIIVTPKAQKDLSELPEKVLDTFLASKSNAKKNIGLGAEPDQAFEKYLSGNMHPLVQDTLGRDYRVWYIEGKYIEQLQEGKIYCLRVLTAKEAHRLESSIPDALAYAQRILE